MLVFTDQTENTDAKLNRPHCEHTYRAETVVVNETVFLEADRGELPVISSQTVGEVPPLIEQSKRRLGESTEECAARPPAPVAVLLFGKGIFSVIGLWNLRRRGSIVTIGHTLSTSRSLPLTTQLGEKSCALRTIFWHTEYTPQPAQPMERG
ncbi:hypothetical protein T265_10967 [Opisthorchis viverrini]|uniref:Uncharacterized protein n=1 Tax=Opisthorchis viverrini TaxID=6198 RepID=A0A074Z0D3_OPIVI|nr:hypothetical protein T265_10967 [Opisthorchis viverrini]KER20501.1 hypothetical protein T265_10967 [Opisthorchis viverrini]